MNLRKAILGASAALSATVLALFLCPGCGKDEQPTPPETVVDTTAPESYMNDPVFRKQLADQRHARNGLMRKRVEIEEAIAAEEKRDPKSPKLAELRQRLDDCDREFEKNRLQTHAIVRKRLTQQKAK